MKNSGKILFLSYNGLLEPIIPSQAVPYMMRLAERGFRFTLLTYEKKRDLDRVGPEGVLRIADDLKSKGIDWRYLRYHKFPPLFSTIFDLLAGAARVFLIVRRERPDIIHMRGITPGIITLLLSGLLKQKVVFDMRGLLAEEYVGGGIWKEDSLVFKLVKKAEKNLLLRADAVTVLTQKHLDLNKGIGYIKDREIPMEVIPCCVDTDKFKREDGDRALRSSLGLDEKFVLMYPGKIGTFYFMAEMLDFYKELSGMISKSVFLVLTNDDTRALVEKADAAGIGRDRLKIIKGIYFDEMPRYMRLADAGIFFINPYKKIGSSPIKMGEFLASEIPVVINPGVGDTEEIVRDNKVGVVVEEFSNADYAAAARDLIELKNEGTAVRARCREAADKYLSLDIAVKKYAKIYDLLTGG